jgi:hypothetical protein
VPQTPHAATRSTTFPSANCGPIDILDLKERLRRCLSRFEYGFYSFACFNVLLKAVRPMVAGRPDSS